MITTVTSVQRFATKTLYTRARATDGSTMLAPMSPGGGKGSNSLWSAATRGGMPQASLESASDRQLFSKDGVT